MKRFLRNCAALLVPLLLLFRAGGQVYQQSNAFRNWEREEGTEKYHSVPESITFAVFGPSHGKEAFQFRDHDGTFFNFALNSQTPQYDLMQMREFQDRIQPGATVVLTVSYISPFWTDDPAEFEDKQSRYYRFLSPGNIVSCSPGRWLAGRWSLLLDVDCGRLISDFLYPQPLMPGTFDLLSHASFRQEMAAGEQQRIRENHLLLLQPGLPDGNPVMLAAYEEMLELCAARGWRAVLVTPPYTSAYTECFPPETLEAFRAVVTRISGEYAVPWLDYSRDGAFTENFSLFRDIDHLNLEGARAFSRRVQADLAALEAA